MQRKVTAVLCVAAVFELVLGSTAAISMAGQTQSSAFLGSSNWAVPRQNSELAEFSSIKVGKLQVEGAAKREVVTTTTAAPSTTVVAKAAVPLPPITATKTVAVSQAGSNQSGVASWYAWIAGGCAHRTAPRGARITVTNVATGVSTSCVVDDYGPAEWTNRIIDLDETVFAKIAPTSMGVVMVHVSW